MNSLYYRKMENNFNNFKNEIVLYQPNEEIKLEVKMDEETVWLTQSQIANLFGCYEGANKM